VCSVVPLLCLFFLISPPRYPPSRGKKHLGCNKIRRCMWVHGLPLPSPKAPAIESKCLVIVVCTSHTLLFAHLILFSLFVEILTLKEILYNYYRHSTFCYCKWMVAPTSSGILLGRSSITKREFWPIDYVDGWWLKDKWRNFDHHCSLLQCWSSSLVQDGGHHLRTSGEIFLSLQGRSLWWRGWRNQE
jgi:hypothetical protein